MYNIDHTYMLDGCGVSICLLWQENWRFWRLLIIVIFCKYSVELCHLFWDPIKATLWKEPSCCGQCIWIDGACILCLSMHFCFDSNTNNYIKYQSSFLFATVTCTGQKGCKEKNILQLLWGWHFKRKKKTPQIIINCSPLE